jgi:multidrug efflux pump
MLLSDAALKNRTTILVLVVILVIAGLVSYLTLPRESAPEVKIPYILITTPHRGADPEVVEETVTNRIEQELTGLKGMKEITSISQEGLSIITVEFDPDVDIDVALQRVKDKVDLAKPELPSNTDEPVEPVIDEINIAEFPIMLISMSGPISPVRMERIGEDLEDEIESQPGVLEVDLLGALEREIILEVDPDRLAMYGLTIEELLQLVPSQNINQSAGGLETEGIRFNVRVPAEVEDPAEIDRFPLAERNGKTIYLTDLATVRDTFKDRDTYSRLNGEPALTLAVKKRVGANIVEVAQRVRGILDEARKVLPAGLTLEVIDDRSEDIHDMVLDLENNILTGLILVLVILMVFMGVRSSLIVALAIPMSMLMSFAIIQAMGVTLNMVVLFSLILALGMLVDNAIVIVENIYRFMEMGYDRLEAAHRGAAEVAWPIIASTATTIAAFSPLLFWPGVMGDFMKYLPMTVIIVLSSSLFVAMIINPVICSRFGKPRAARQPAAESDSRFVAAYRRLLQGGMAHPVSTLLAAFFLLASVLILYGKLGRGIELFPDTDPDQARISLRAPQGTHIEETDRTAGLIERRVDPFRTGPDGSMRIEHVVTNVGSAGGGFGGGTSGPHVAELTLVFPDYEDRVDNRGKPWKSANVINRIREALVDVPGAEIKIEENEEGPPTGAPVTVRIIGEDMNVLKDLNRRAMDLMKDVPNLVNIQSDLEAEKPELVFLPDRRRAAMLGINTAVISNTLKSNIFGTKVGDYRHFNDEYDIRIRLPEDERSRLDHITRYRVQTPAGKSVPITSLGRFEYRPGMGTIHRIDRKRAVTITADNEGRLGPDVLADVQERLRQLDLPPGYRIEYAGEKEEQDEASAFLFKAFALAVGLIIAILVTQFNTLSAPLIIITTVLLSTVGVFVGLLVGNLPFGIIMTGVGVISLAGVVVNNAIVLLDYTRQLQRRGKTVTEAAVEAGITRLRPVLLTAGTTILGLVPMATGVSFDFHSFEIASRSSSSQWWRSMAIAVIFGLGFATMLTLVVVPSFYVMLYRLTSRLGIAGLRPSEAQQGPKPVLEDY